jgi:hypothetical protein
MIGAGLAGGIGIVGAVGRFLAEAPRRAQRAEDLVGRDVVEAKARLGLAGEILPVAARRFQQVEGADEIGVDERVGPVDRAVDMRLGGQISATSRLYRSASANAPKGGFEPA